MGVVFVYIALLKVRIVKCEESFDHKKNNWFSPSDCAKIPVSMAENTNKKYIQ